MPRPVTEQCSRRAASVGGISRFSFARKSPRAPVELRNAPRAPHTRDQSNMLCTARALAFTAPARRGGTERRVAASPRITSAPATTSRRFGKYLRGASGKALVGCHVSASEAPTARARADRREPSVPPRRVPARTVASGARPSRARPNHRSRARCSVAFVRRSSHSPWGSLSRSPTRRPRWPGFRENRKVSPFTAPRRRCP